MVFLKWRRWLLRRRREDESDHNPSMTSSSRKTLIGPCSSSSSSDRAEHVIGPKTPATNHNKKRYWPKSSTRRYELYFILKNVTCKVFLYSFPYWNLFIKFCRISTEILYFFSHLFQSFHKLPLLTENNNMYLASNICEILRIFLTNSNILNFNLQSQIFFSEIFYAIYSTRIF